MKRWWEILVFVTLAVAIHIAFFASAPRSGSTSGGNGGEALVSIQAAAQTVVEMVNAWERPPEVQSVLKTEMDVPEAPTSDTPAIPQIEIGQAPRAEMRVALAPPDAPDELQIDVAPPPPPRPEPEVELEADVRPRQRPQEPATDHGAKADVNSDGRKEQKSAGAGGGSQAGAGTNATAVADGGRNAKLKSVWGAKIRARIEHYKRYPRGVKATGTVVVEITVSREGRLVSYRIRSSSGSAELDNAALGSVTRAKKFPKAPKKLAGNTFRFNVPMKLGPG